VEKLSQPKHIFEALYSHFLRLADSPAPTSGASWKPAPAPESPALAAFVGGDPQADRLLCVRAMSAIYDHHAGAVGGLRFKLPRPKSTTLSQRCFPWVGGIADIFLQFTKRYVWGTQYFCSSPGYNGSFSEIFMGG